MNDFLDTMYITMLDQFRDDRCNDLYKQIKQEVPHEIFMRIEPMINEIVDRAMEKAFTEGYRIFDSAQ